MGTDLAIDGKTLVLGVIGDPIEHTMSPLMQNTAIKEMGVNAVYVPFHVSPDNLAHAVNGICTEPSLVSNDPLVVSVPSAGGKGCHGVNAYALTVNKKAINNFIFFSLKN